MASISARVYLIGKKVKSLDGKYPGCVKQYNKIYIYELTIPPFQSTNIPSIVQTSSSTVAIIVTQYQTL